METSKVGLELIRHYEGIKIVNGICVMYHGGADKPGVFTIGWGHKVRDAEMPRLKAGVSLDEAERLFVQDVASHARTILQAVTPAVNLAQNEFDALSSFQFNLGPSILTTGNDGQATTLLNRLNALDRHAAALQIPLFSYSNSKFQPGLFFRRLTETLLFITGMLHFASEKSARAVISETAAALKDPSVETQLNDFYRKQTGHVLPAPGAQDKNPVYRLAGRQT